MPAYFVLASSFLFIWFILFYKRRDLRKEMLIQSFAIWIFAFYDYFSQPGYWKPETWLSIPVGIEGFLFAFGFSGTAAVLYEELFRFHLKKIREKPNVHTLHWFVVGLVVIFSVSGSLFFGQNIMTTLLPALFIGSFLIVLLRQDLLPQILFSSVFFGVIYASILFVWLTIFPDARSWWNPSFLGEYLTSIPLGEIVFGFGFGAFWGPIYEFLFGYKLIH